MDYTNMSFLYDFAFMSLLLVIAQFLRSHIKFLQMFYIPASVLAGIMGLLLGPQFLNVIPWSGKIGSYAYMLVCVLFGGLFLGKKEKTSLKKVFTHVGDSFCVNMGAEFLCFGVALLVGGALVMTIFPDVFPEISLLMPSGYCGGHGYASTIGTALNNLLGREDGVILGQTFATMGLLTGLFVGIACINYATRKGATRLVDKAESLPEDCRTGIVPAGKRTSMGEETINPMSMDPLAWHLALTLIATLAGYKFYDWYKQYLPDIELPVMCLTMIFGVIIQTIINHTPFRDSVDEHVEGRIGSHRLPGGLRRSLHLHHRGYGICRPHPPAVCAGHAHLPQLYLYYRTQAVPQLLV
jgi:ESS family glutamate:Na+ symporter